MKVFTFKLTALAFSASAVFAAPSGFTTERRANNCEFATAVQVTAYGAAGVSNTLDITYDNQWHDITNNGENPALGISSVSWFSFPIISCEFQGVDTTPVLNNGITTDFNSAFDVSPPQTLIAARCSCDG